MKEKPPTHHDSSRTDETIRAPHESREGLRAREEDRITDDARGARRYSRDAGTEIPPDSAPVGSHGGGGEERGWQSRAHVEGADRGWRDDRGAYGLGGYGEGLERPAPRSGYGEQGFGAGETSGGRWGGGQRGGYGGGEPGGLHGTRGGAWAAAAERYEQGRGPRSYGPDGWGGRPAFSRQGRPAYGADEAPWRQSEFAGRGEFGEREADPGGWNAGHQADPGRWNAGREVDPGRWSPERGFDADPAAGAGTFRERWNVPGPFTGRGPRDYRRSEAAIRDDVCERLTRHGQVDARRIRVEVENGEVILEGTVDTRAAKRMAEDAAETVSGVRDVHNRLRIEYRVGEEG